MFLYNTPLILQVGLNLNGPVDVFYCFKCTLFEQLHGSRYLIPGPQYHLKLETFKTTIDMII